MKPARDVIAAEMVFQFGVGCEKAADAILAALNASGYVVAPREPTQAMREAGFHARVASIAKMVERPEAPETEFAHGLRVGRSIISGRETDAAYRAMIAAIPIAEPERATHAPDTIRTAETAFDAETARAAEIGSLQAMRWRHKKRGTEYVEVGRGWLQTGRPLTDNEPIVAYQSVKADGMFWVRPVDEFEDGRFERVTAAPEQPATGIEPPGCPTPGACSCPDARVAHLARLLDTVRSIPDQELSETVCQNLDAAFGVDHISYTYWSATSSAFDEMRARDWLKPEIAALLPEMPLVEPKRNANGTAADVVTGRLEWRGEYFCLGPFVLGGYLGIDPVKDSAAVKWMAWWAPDTDKDYSRNFPTKSAARAAVERAVRDAIAGDAKS